jgi:hypothetical protein
MRPDPMEIPIGMAYDIIGSTWNEKCHQQGVIITLAARACRGPSLSCSITQVGWGLRTDG